VPWQFIVVGVIGLVVVGGFFAMRARAQDPSADPSTAASASAGVASLETILEAPGTSNGGGDSDPAKRQILAKTSVADAIEMARPMMSNTVGRLDLGSALLAIWASKNLTWSAIEGLQETSPSLFKKDPEAERGRRLCMSGTILEIRAEKTLAGRIVEDRALPLIERTRNTQSAANDSDQGATHAEPGSSASPLGMPDPLVLQGTDLSIPDGGKVYFATLQSKPEPLPEGTKAKPRDTSSLFVEVIAVRSSGNLVDGTEARVCGVLTGVTVPPAGINTAAALDAATVHRLVGMFDLPQNHIASASEATAAHN
jgi:hypothetical protein